MNKAITDGLMLMPPAFAGGLDVWSSEDGTPGSNTYDGSANAALVPADQDFGGCLELVKTDNTQKLRYMGETPILPGCYLRVTARIKAITGNLPSVRIAGWAGKSGGVHVAGLNETGPSVALTSYGEVVEVSAIIGSGDRTGVDMIWGTEPIYGHFGLDLTGSNGAVVRIDDIIIEDITSAFYRTMMDWVDVRDYGAIGDGSTDDFDAFTAADDAANGRAVLVPAGVYRLGDSFTFENRVRFEGTVTMDTADRLVLRKNFELGSYIDAFGDEVLAFKKAFQALLNFTDHDSLDLAGRRIELDAPIDMQAAVANQTTFEVRRIIRNGQINLVSSTNWDTETHLSTASYNTGNPKKLTNVVNVANIPVGSLVTGTGAGREVYVKDRNIGANEITLSQPLWGANASQNYTFTRFKYALDFSGFAKISKLTISDVEIQCNGFGSGILLAPAGETFHVKDCFITRPRDRCITSHGTGCQDLQIDRCHFSSDEQSVPATARTSIVFNVNANDAKIRDSRFQRFLHTGVLNGNGHLIVGNHWFQGDGVTDGPRVAGFIFTYPNMNSVITGNYIDNCFVEWTNEHDANPDFSSEFSFGGLSLTGNIFMAIDVAAWFTWIVIKPYGPGHFLQGMNVQGNTFKAINGNIDRIEMVDNSIADLDYSRSRNVIFEGNSFNGINQAAINPVTLEFDQATNASTWTLNVADYLPFGGNARTVTSVVAEGDILNSSNQVTYNFPSVTPNAGAGNDLVQLKWPQSCRGKVQVTARMDNPV
ncbi:MAG: right-handed parallel beta-helix repeat-containing protein [Rhodobacter sp.]|nr:right-handed parallel beta-helix repeat-containing protein [Rhodobacter sp.]